MTPQAPRRKAARRIPCGFGAAAVFLALVSCRCQIVKDERARWWSEVMHLRDRGDTTSADFRQAIGRTLELQGSILEDGEEVTLERLRTREGRTVSFVCSANPHAGPGERFTDFWEGDAFVHRLLDAEGRLLRPESDVFMRHSGEVRHFVEEWRSTAFDCLHVQQALRSLSPPYEHSVDERGFVPHGYIARDAVGAPIGYETDPTPIDRGRVEQLLASPFPGDLLRALWLLELGPPESAALGRGLLRHADEDVRARAVVVVGRSGEDLGPFRSFTADPSPRVRLAALYVFVHRGQYSEFALELERDSDPAVALTASEYLCWAEDLAIARRSLLTLLAARDFRAIGDHHFGAAVYRRYAELSSPAMAEAVVAWLEEDLEREARAPEEGICPPVLALEETFAQLRAEHLRPLAGRIRTVYERVRGVRGWEWITGLLTALVKTEDPDADRLAGAALEEAWRIKDSGTDLWIDFQSLWSEIFEWCGDHGGPLLGRTRPFNAAIPFLWQVALRRDPSDDRDVSITDPRGSPMKALLVLARWAIAGAEDRLIAGLKRPDNDWRAELRSLADDGLVPGALLDRIRAAGIEMPPRPEAEKDAEADADP